MESCGVSGADAKILQLEGVMQGVAGEWVEEQSKVFDERVARLEGLYGAGSYFADALCKSHQYAQVWPSPPAD